MYLAKAICNIDELLHHLCPQDSCNENIDSADVVILKVDGKEVLDIIDELDNLINESFMKFLKINTPAYDCASSRIYCDEIYIAKYKKEIIGCLFAYTCGCFRILSDVAVLPKYWNNHIGSILVQKLLDKSNPKNKYISHDCLETYTNSFHCKFYYKFGFQNQYLQYTTQYDLAQHRNNKTMLSNMNRNDSESKLAILAPLKAADDGNDDININQLKNATVINQDDCKKFINEAEGLCESQFKGWNYTNLIENLLKSELNISVSDLKDLLDGKNTARLNKTGGNVFGLYDNNGNLVSFCIGIYRQGRSIKCQTFRVLFGIAKDLKWLKHVIVEIAQFVSNIDQIKTVKIGMDTKRVDAFDMIVNELKFTCIWDDAGIAMVRMKEKGQYTDFETRDACILGTYR